jgi:ATP-dependent protease ClpP protease subunit
MQKLTFFNYKINNNTSGESCDIHIDGVIVDASTEQIIKDWWGDDTPTSFKSVRNQIGESVKTVNVFVNSGGGQVTEAMAIHDYLKNLASKGITVNTYGRGIVASAATYILMASANSTISENSWFMVHNVSGGIYGDVNEIENYAVMMRKFNDQITDFYATNTGLSSTVIKNMMNKETWFNGKEAVEQGFVKKVEDNTTFTNSITKENWLFNNTQVLQAYNSFTSKTPIKMDIKKLVMDALKEAGLIKNEADTKQHETIADAVANALKPLNDEVDTKITNAVTEATKDLGTTVANAVTEALKNVVTKEDIKDLATTASVTDEIKKVTDELEAVKADVATRKGGEAGNKGEGGTNRDGISWQA